MPEWSTLEVTLGSNHSKKLVSDEGIILRFTDGEILGSTLGLDNGVTLDLDGGYELDSFVGSFDIPNYGKPEGSLLGI